MRTRSIPEGSNLAMVMVSLNWLIFSTRNSSASNLIIGYWLPLQSSLNPSRTQYLAWLSSLKSQLMAGATSCSSGMKPKTTLEEAQPSRTPLDEPNFQSASQSLPLGLGLDLDLSFSLFQTLFFTDFRLWIWSVWKQHI